MSLSLCHNCRKKEKQKCLSFCQNCGDAVYCEECRDQCLYKERSTFRYCCTNCLVDVASRRWPDDKPLSFEDAIIVDVFH
jgi:hypothetical protein